MNTDLFVYLYNSKIEERETQEHLPQRFGN